MSKNGRNYGRLYYVCSRDGEDRCSFFLFVEPSQHYMDRQEPPAKVPRVEKVIESIKLEEVKI